jgi:hypothetical protein
MLSIAELTHKRYPKAIAEMLCQELQPLNIEQLDVAVDIVDSILEIQIRADSAIDKEKLLTLVHSKLQNLHIESVSKFRIHCWRNNEETHEKRLLWTEQFMLDMPKLSLTSSPDIDPELEHLKQTETRSPEPQLSKHSVLQDAIKKIAPTNSQAKKHLLASDLAQDSLANDLTITSTALTQINRQQPQSSNSNYWQLLFVGLSIIALGLGIGASVRAITAKAVVESNSSSSLAIPSVENKELTNTPSLPKNTPIQTSQPSAVTTQTTPKANPTSTEPIANPNELAQEQVITLEKFNRIQKGMTIEQVEKVFGASGKVIAENNSSNSIGQVYSWKNHQGSNAIIEFKDGQVVAKAQAGL